MDSRTWWPSAHKSGRFASDEWQLPPVQNQFLTCFLDLNNPIRAYNKDWNPGAGGDNFYLNLKGFKG